MSEKRVRTAPVRYVSWKEGEKHAPMAIRKRIQKVKEMKEDQQAYQKEYREKKKEEKAGMLENEENVGSIQAEKKKEKLKIDKIVYRMFCFL